jgi:phosphonate transport system substrate-binding protein
MRGYFVLIVRLLILMTFSMLSSCGNMYSDLDEQGNPKVLRLGISTSSEDAQVVFRRYEPVRDYLERTLEVPVTYYEVNNYAPVIEALRAKKIHVGNLPPLAYLIARKKADLLPLYTMGLNDGSQTDNYRASIVTHKSSGIETMEDLKANMHKLSLVFVDPASSSGHIVPHYYMIQQGINPKEDFERVIFATNHLSTVLNVHSGRVDVACVQTSVIDRIATLTDGDVSPGDFNMLWYSDPLPTTASVIRADVSPEFRERLLHAYVNMKEQDSVAWNTIIDMRREFYSSFMSIDSLRYIPVDESIYDEFDHMLDVVGVFNIR